jgi:chromate transporter
MRSQLEPPPPISLSRVELFTVFLGVGLSGFGGVLPFARRALVERRSWLTDAGFNETLALCQSLPGPNIVNMSVVVGSRFAGALGALAAVAGLLLAPIALVLVVVQLWSRFGANGQVASGVKGLAAAAAGLVIATTVKMARPLVAGAPVSAGLLLLAAFIAVGVLRWSLPMSLLALSSVSLLIPRGDRP